MSQQPVVITDIDIPFMRMVMIILKWMLASIPAVILLYMIMGFLWMMTFGLFMGAMTMSH